MQDADYRWCEHCRDHFPGDHYDESGRHRIGAEYGPTGAAMDVSLAVERMKLWAQANPGADTQGLDNDEWLALARAALDQ